MGIIAKQSIKGSIFTYIGVVLGYVTSALMMPHILSSEQIGLLDVLGSIAAIVASFGSLGFTNVINRVFPYFKSDKNKQAFFEKRMIQFISIGIILSIIVVLGLKNQIIDKDNYLLSTYFYYIIPLMIFTLTFGLLDVYNRMLYDILSGILIKDVLFRLLNLLFLILYFFKCISFHQFVIYYSFIWGGLLLLLTLSLVKKKAFIFNNSKINHSNIFTKSIIKVAVWGLFTSLASVAIERIDKLMINSFLGLSDTGIYSRAFYFGVLILIPSRSLKNIIFPFIGDALKNNNLEKVTSLYKKSSLILNIIGTFLLFNIWINIHNILELLPEEYHKGKYVILYISITYLINIIPGIPGIILNASKFYKSISICYIIFFILIVLTNYILIPLLGINGAAIASLISMFLFMLIQTVIVYKKFNIHPFNYKHIVILSIGIILYYTFKYIPNNSNIYFDVFIKSSIFSISYIGLVYVIVLKRNLSILKLK